MAQKWGTHGAEVGRLWCISGAPMVPKWGTMVQGWGTNGARWGAHGRPMAQKWGTQGIGWGARGICGCMHLPINRVGRAPSSQCGLGPSLKGLGLVPMVPNWGIYGKVWATHGAQVGHMWCAGGAPMVQGWGTYGAEVGPLVGHPWHRGRIPMARKWGTHNRGAVCPWCRGTYGAQLGYP